MRSLNSPFFRHSPHRPAATTSQPSLRSSADEAYNRATEDLKNGNYNAVIADYSEVIRLKPNDPIGYWLRGKDYWYLDQNEKAINDYNEAIRLDPNSPGAYSDRGKAYRDLDQYDKAISDYNQAIRLKPDFAEAYLNRGDAYYLCKQYEKAISDAKAIHFKSDFGEAYRTKGVVLREIGGLRQG